MGGIHGRRKLEVRALSVQVPDDLGGGPNGVGFEEEFSAQQLFHIVGEELVHRAAAQHRVGSTEMREHA